MITICFLGAARNVTGSRFLVQTQKAKVLIECGLYQERDYQDRNWDRFDVDPSTIDAVLLTHGHLDHCGLLPKLAAEGFNGPIYCTSATAGIVPIVLTDSANLQEEDARYKEKRMREEGREPKYPIRPLYTREDVQGMLDYFSPVELDTDIPVADGFTAVFKDAGHILGSASIRLTVNDGEKERSIVFSGDVGRWDRPILNDPEQFEATDYLVMESTYGDRDHDSSENVQKELEKLIKDACDRGGNILIPAFAIERSQEILYRLNLLFREKRIPPLTTFLDSPMAVKVTQVFKKHKELYDQDMRELMEDGTSPFSFNGLKLVRGRKDSMAINRIRGCAIIIAGSGMCTGGRIKHHLVHNIERPEATILFVGYQASGTLGRRIVEGEKRVRILGQERPVRAKVVQLHGFSGHADRNELVRWVEEFKQPPKKVFIIHGGSNVTRKFAEFLHEKTGLTAHVPGYRDSVELE